MTYEQKLLIRNLAVSAVLIAAFLLVVWGIWGVLHAAFTVLTAD
jgi:hypothetical protein